MIDPGQLKTRLVVQQPIETPDDQGGVVRNGPRSQPYGRR
jgi:head-tail adaptor